MSVIKKFVSILLAASLCIGSIFSVQGDTVFMADAAARPAIPSSYIQGLLDQFSSDPDYETASLALRSYFNDPDIMIVFHYSSDRTFNITFWKDSMGSFRKVYVFDNRMICYQGFFQGCHITCDNGNIVNALSWTNQDRIVYWPGSLDVNANLPVTGNMINSGIYGCYFNYDLYSWDTEQVIYSPNLYEEWGPPDPPAVQYFDLIRFQLGSRTYLTTSDQSLIRSINPDTEGLEFYIGYMFEEQEHLDHIHYSDLQVIQGAEYMIAAELENISPIGVYCYDITNLEYDSIFFAKFLHNWYGEWLPLYEASNLPLNAPAGPGDVVQPYDQAWEQIINYYNTYNTTHVVPEELAEFVFGWTGSKTIPCDISVPGSRYDQWNDPSYGPAPQQTDYSITAFQYGFNNSYDRFSGGYNFNLFNVVIIPASGVTYSLRYWYSDGSTPKYDSLDTVSFSSLCEMFDVIIIVPDDHNILHMDPVGGGDLLPIGYTGSDQRGSSTYGIRYTSDSDDLIYNHLSGFLVMTRSAIQKQQLYNFNDGFTKTYDLMVQYINKRDSWDDSFLLWSSSVFDMLNSLDGRLSKIEWFLSGDIKLSDYLNNILDKLEKLVDNTSKDEVSPDSWYASLWRFVKRFDIQDSTFSHWLDDFDDFYDDLPDLPEIQPTIIPFPTYIPEPTEATG